MTLKKYGKPINPEKIYVVAGGGSINEGTRGPPIWDVVANQVKWKKTINLQPNQSIRAVGA